MDDLPQIERGIPIPAKRKNDPIKALLAKLEVGDSLLFPSRSRAESARQSARLLKISTTVREMEDGSWRLWRTKKGGE